MIFRRPCYYDDFCCKADKCSDNCCIGWEICIDESTATKYRNEKSDFGNRLRENISFTDEPSFILKDERCPFLNENNLCDIIINIGKNSLCQICRDHPRYFEWYGNTKEGGIGLSCEEAARLILTDSCYADYFESEVDEEVDEDFDESTFAFLFSVREKIYDILCDLSLPIEMRFSEILSLSEGAELLLSSEAPQNKGCAFSFEAEAQKMVPVLEKTEAIDDNWTEKLNGLRSLTGSKISLKPDKEEEKYIERLTAYFIHRYFLKSIFDARITEKIRFAFFSVTVILALYKNEAEQSFETMLRCAVLYSKQMEYSDENIDIFMKHCIINLKYNSEEHYNENHRNRKMHRQSQGSSKN